MSCFTCESLESVEGFGSFTCESFGSFACESLEIEC